MISLETKEYHSKASVSKDISFLLISSFSKKIQALNSQVENLLQYTCASPSPEFHEPLLMAEEAEMMVLAPFQGDDQDCAGVLRHLYGSLSSVDSTCESRRAGSYHLGNLSISSLMSIDNFFARTA